MLEMVSETAGAEEAAKLEKAVAATKLVDTLTFLRNKAGLTQKDLADRLNCTQSKISKFEGSLDADLRFDDIVAYTKATGHQIMIVITPKDQSLVNKVKMHALMIKRALHDMVAMAGTDGTMMKGVARFLQEAAFNLVRFVQSAAENIPNLPESKIEHVRVETPEEDCSTTLEDPKSECEVNAAGRGVLTQ